MKKFNKNQARLHIMRAIFGSHLLAFESKQWTSANLDLRSVQVGDLVAMQSAPPSAHYLSWVVETRLNNHCDIEFLLESIDDGSLCWWSNIGLTFFDREAVSNHPEWRWLDRQFKFQKQWFRTASRNRDHGLVPVHPSFGEGFSVTIDVRVKFNFDDYRNPLTFQDYRKVKVKQMTEHWLEAVNDYNEKSRQRRAEGLEI